MKKVRTVRIAIIVPGDDAGKQLVEACHTAAKALDETLRGRINPAIKEYFFSDKTSISSIADDCDVGIAFGDRISECVNSVGVKIPFLLMSAADIAGMNELYLKAYPSAATMGILLAKLTCKIIEKKKDSSLNFPVGSLCALFEESAAGKACRKAYEEVLKRSLMVNGELPKGIVEMYGQDVECNVGKFIEGHLQAHKRIFCVYGFATTGPAYCAILNELQKRRNNDGCDLEIITDVNVPDGIDAISHVICGVEKGNTCVGSRFFCQLMASLLELIVRSVLWSKSDIVRDARQSILENARFVYTRMGILSFVDDELTIPFVYQQADGSRSSAEEFRDINDTRESVAISMSRVDQLAADIANAPLGKIEDEFIKGKLRAVNDILNPCFSAKRVYFLSSEHSSLNDSFNISFPKELSCELKVLQVSYGERDIENTNVNQLYVVGRSGDEISPIADFGKSHVEGIRGVVLGADIREATNKVKAGDYLLQDGPAALFVSAVNEESSAEGRYLYYVSACATNGSATQGVVIFTDVKFRNVELVALKNFAERFYGAVNTVSRKLQIQVASLNVAIGSIMSRNGSHNIGSHVLAALSHNVGTMPEDRKLYQYIQHRMDYIATATTEFPVWKQPMQLVGGILKTFMSQTHLLDYISRSEGLSAYRFQGTSLELGHQPNTIRLHVRRLRTGCNEVHEVVEHEFIDYPDEKGGYESVRDVMVAIPGGVVGQHAVFTILENIIRNAAKHDWSTRRKANANDNLDIYIDFHDNVGRGRVEVLVYNKSAEPEKKIQSIVMALNAKINQSFLSEENGSLRRENWGLAEMRISVGYLNNASIEKIGGIGADAGRSSELIRAEAVKQGKGKACLGFRFDLPKPKELLIVLPKRNALGDKVIGKINLALGPYGIEVMTYDAMMSSKGLAYSFVLMEDVAEILSASDEAGWPGLPFRVLSSKPIKVKGWGQKNCPIIPTCNAYVDIVESLTKCSQVSEVSVFATKTLECAYACWICHVKGIRGINDDPVNLIVDPYQDGTSAGKSLVTDADLLHYVFNNSFNAAVRSFFKTVAPTTKECDLFFAGGLYLLAMSPKAGTLSVPELSAKKTAREMAYAQLLAWAMHLDGHESTSTAKLDLEQTVQDGAPYVSDQWRAVLQDAQDSEETVRRACFASQLNSSFAGRDVSANRFVDFLVDVVLEQSRSFLSRYEEQIATLPTSFQAGRADLLDSDGDKKPVPVLFSPVVKCGGNEMRHKKAVISLLVTKERSRAAEYAHTGVNYWRHGPENEKQAMLGSRLYLESLSGSQTYFSSIEALAHERAKLKDLTSEGLPILAKVIRMVECGLVRIAIVDERAKKFRDAHPDVAGVFGMTGIAVYDDQDDLSKINSENCEVLIIHQGVIDKLVSDHTPENVGEYLRKWKARVRYVIVTTGRGMPSNIPSTARVLPFSIIESALFKRYPEKMLLVDNIMNILPKGERSDDCSVCGA